ncbi:unnamed protein product [Dovyalis caffra]|uniref:Uncharacterized protein n=1 Tax=Dovyalis caffra TaxID=77055 RepID=A0AAV1SQL7_9ROSI|nr:unnamed protein product [Dovyalis caffra]
MVLSSLKGERGDVELRTVGRQIHGKVLIKELALKDMEHDIKIETPMTLEEMINSLSEVEKQEMRAFRFQQLQLLKDAFNQLVERLDSNVRLECIPLYLEENKNSFVDSEDYMALRMYVPIMKELFARNGDIGEDWLSSRKVKSVLFFVVCGVTQSMRMTSIVDINEDVLHQWWRCIKLVDWWLQNSVHEQSFEVSDRSLLWS